jgi:hypothetical protein
MGVILLCYDRFIITLLRIHKDQSVQSGTVTIYTLATEHMIKLGVERLSTLSESDTS